MDYQLSQQIETNQKDRKKILIELIIETRKAASNLIKQNIRFFVLRKRSLTKYLCLIIHDRIQKSRAILQRSIRRFIMKKYLLNIKHKQSNNFISFVYQNLCKSAKLKIFDFHIKSPFRNDTSQEFDLKYCRLRKIHIVSIKRSQLFQPKYYFYFIIDGNTIISPDYTGEFNNFGEYFNVVQIKPICDDNKVKKKHSKRLINRLTIKAKLFLFLKCL